MEIFNRPNIVNNIKRGELEWAGHACRIQKSIVQRVLQENPRSKRPLSKAKFMLEDGIKKDFQNTIKGNYEDQDLMEAAENKKKWKRIYSTARWSQKKKKVIWQCLGDGTQVVDTNGDLCCRITCALTKLFWTAILH